MSYMNTISAAEDFKDCPIIRASEKSGTIYLVQYSTSDNAKETTYEKVKRLILNDSDAFKPISAREQKVRGIFAESGFKSSGWWFKI